MTASIEHEKVDVSLKILQRGEVVQLVFPNDKTALTKTRLQDPSLPAAKRRDHHHLGVR